MTAAAVNNDDCSHIICADAPGNWKHPLNCNLHLNRPVTGLIYGATKKFVPKSKSVVVLAGSVPTV